MARETPRIGLSSFPADRRGSVMVEVALFVPAIMFLLLAGVTMVNAVMLVRATDRAAALIADEFSQRPAIADADIDDALTAATGMTGTGGYPLGLRLDIRAVEITPDATSLLWSRSRASGGSACAPADAAFSAPEGAHSGSGVLYLLQVDLCATPGAGFYLAGALGAAGFTAHGRAVAIGRTAALRALN